MYTVKIADVAELTQEVLEVDFDSTTPGDSEARSSTITNTITITGRISYDSEKAFMKESTKKIAAWSMLKPDSADTYKTVTVEFDHTGVKRTYELSHAFVVSFHEKFKDQNGFFTLVVRQKKDRLDGAKLI